MNDKETILKFPNLSAIESEAALWIAKLNGGGISPEEREAFREWQEQSPHHREAVGRLSVVWSELGMLKELPVSWDSSSELGARAVNQRPRRPIITTGARRAIAAAAVLMVFAALGFGTGLLSFNRTEVQSFQTAIGAQRKVTLSDGSTILLNTNSHVDIRLSRNERDIYLTKGEAYFEVAHDKARPFVVFAGSRTVRAVGTAFAVRLADRAVEVTVAKGEVELGAFSPNTPSAMQHIEPTITRTVPRRLGRLAAGQNAIFDDKIENLAMVSEAELDRKLTWRRGYIAFSGETLAQVIGDISRYTTLTIEIADPRLRELRIDGYFEVGNVNALIEALEHNFHVRVTHVNSTLVRLEMPT